MNRTSPFQRVAALTVLAVLACGWLQTAEAQMVGGPQPDPKVFKVYHLRYVSPRSAEAALRGLMEEYESSSIRIAAGSNETLVISATRDEYKKIEEVLKLIDVAPAPEPETQIKVFSLLHAEPTSAVKLLATLLPQNTRIAVDERTRSLVASGSRNALAIAEAVLTKLDVEAVGERPKSSANYEVRVLWLANDNKGKPPADDLKDVVAEIARLGVKDPRQIGQIIVRTSAGNPFQLSSLPYFAGQPNKLTVSGGVFLEKNEGGVMLEIAIKAQKLPEPTLSDITTRIVLPEKQYVVLATSPIGDVTSVFVVQVTSQPRVKPAR
jgi:hypothetical protein